MKFEEFHFVRGSWMFVGEHGSTQALFGTHPLIALWLRSNEQLREVEWQIGRRRFRVVRRNMN